MAESTIGDRGPLSAKGTRLNRRGLETRQRLLTVALRCLAEGGVETVNASLVAREAGVTWGTVQHQFGDVDGLWAAALEYAAAEGGLRDAETPDQTDLGERVGAVVEMLWSALGLQASRACYQLRHALPQDRDELESGFPRTARAIAAWEEHWSGAVEHAFAGLDLDPEKVAGVRAMLLPAVRGLRVEDQSVYGAVDVEAARTGLRDAITAYLSS